MLSARAVLPSAGLFIPPSGPSSASAEGSRPSARAETAEQLPGLPVAADVAAGSSGGGGYGSGAGAAGSRAGRGAVAVFDKKVYVSLYADGPTQVLCFSDSPLAGSGADEQGGTQQLMSRLHQVARQLMQVERQLGSAYNMRTARGSRPVPAVLLLQQQRGAISAAGEAAGSGGGASMPLALHATGGGWHASGTTTAAVALLQQMNLQQMQAAASGPAGLRMGSLTDGGAWTSAEAAAAVAAGRYLSESDMRQVNTARLPVFQQLHCFQQALETAICHHTCCFLSGVLSTCEQGLTQDGSLQYQPQSYL